MSTVINKNQLQELKLYGILGNIDDVVVSATKEKWSYSELLGRLIQCEYDYQDQASTERRIKAAHFPKGASLENYDFAAKRSISKVQIQELANLKWIEAGRPLLLIGQTGFGKSFIAEALGRHACRNKKTVLFKDFTALTEIMNQAHALGTYLRLRERLSRPDVLIIDDFGMRKVSSVEAQDLKEILEVRSLGKSTIITTQLPLNHWSEVIADSVILDAILDLVEHSSIKIECKGESYRKVKAKRLDRPAGQE
jgi:DNA replication protein DnaC